MTGHQHRSRPDERDCTVRHVGRGRTVQRQANAISVYVGVIENIDLHVDGCENQSRYPTKGDRSNIMGRTESFCITESATRVTRRTCATGSVSRPEKGAGKTVKIRGITAYEVYLRIGSGITGADWTRLIDDRREG